MRKLLIFGLLLCSFRSFSASQIIRGTVTVTNAPTTNSQALGVLFVAGSTTRIWTNDPSLNPAIYIQTNLTIAGSATNLWNHLAAAPIYPSYGIDPAASLASNAVTIISSVGGGLTLSVTGFWASVSYATQTVAEPLTIPVRVPFTVEIASNQTYVASKVAEGIGNLSTNAFATNAVALSNYVSASPIPQSFGNKTMTNGLIDGARESNIVAWAGTIFRASNGVYVTPSLISPYTTNLTNIGLAISSAGSATGAEQFGTGALATNTSATAVGKIALGGGISSTALGNNAKALGDSSVSLGQDSSTGVGASGAVVVGQDSHATTNNTGVFGNASQATHQGAFVIGVAVLSSTNNEITLGTSGYTVNVPGRLIAASVTNFNGGGTNIYGGDASYPRYNNASLANGNNAAILIGTNRFVNGSGPTAAYTLNGFQGGRDGKIFLFIKTNSFTCTIANDSGVDPTAANRILTGTGADATSTNNPGCLEFIYLGDLQRWLLIRKSN